LPSLRPVKFLEIRRTRRDRQQGIHIFSRKSVIPVEGGENGVALSVLYVAALPLADTGTTRIRQYSTSDAC
jgi:hypothetical protein